jgi:hypothetical protein
VSRSGGVQPQDTLAVERWLDEGGGVAPEAVIRRDMAARRDRAPRSVVAAGGGVAALDLVLALHDLAGDRVAVTVVAPEADFTLRPPSTGATFAHGRVERYRLRPPATRRR